MLSQGDQGALRPPQRPVPRSDRPVRDPAPRAPDEKKTDDGPDESVEGVGRSQGDGAAQKVKAG